MLFFSVLFSSYAERLPDRQPAEGTLTEAWTIGSTIPQGYGYSLQYDRVWCTSKPLASCEGPHIIEVLLYRSLKEALFSSSNYQARYKDRRLSVVAAF